MNENLSVIDRWEIQKNELSQHAGLSERIAQVTMEVDKHEWKGGFKVFKGQERIPAGFVIVDKETKDEDLVLRETPDHFITPQWQGEQLTKQMGKWATVSPVKKTVNVNTPHQREVLIGWRIHTEDELSKRSQQHVRQTMIDALSERIDESKLWQCTDAELHLMALLMLNKDIGLARTMTESRIPIPNDAIKDPIHTLVETIRQHIWANQGHGTNLY